MKDEETLSNTEFFNVFWKEEDLDEDEQKAYRKKCTETAKELRDTFPSIQDLYHKCPNCKKDSELRDYYGHILEAECPKCHHKFTPTNEQLFESLYSRNFSTS